jgi:phenylacetate-coenzyme A ligase PaaK-like adenylate-forming protein
VSPKAPSDQLRQIEKLCLSKNPYDQKASDDPLFVDAMKENISWHAEHSELYRNLLKEKGISPGKWSGQLEELPFIFANFFKKYEVLSIPKEDVFLHLTSSGTTGQKSQIFFDEWTIRSAQEMVDRIFDYYGWITPDSPCNYLLYTYEPEEGSKLGTAYTDNFLCKYAPVSRVTYALKSLGKGKGHKFDAFGVVRALQEYAEEGLPVRILGFPSFFHFTLKLLRDQEIGPLKLHPESLTFFGGGWKGHQDKAISKRDLYREATELLGIPDHRLRDGFGSVEHCVPYIECANHNFHVPVYSRVLIRDVETLKSLPNGQTGYLNFISPYITSVPANNVLMGDLAIKHSGDECGCGLSNDYFEIIGRAGLAAGKSCAISASEMLKEFSP